MDLNGPTALQNPYTAALQNEVDSEFPQELRAVLQDADLLWSILSTNVHYTTPPQDQCFNMMTDSPLFLKFEPKSFDTMH